MTHMVADIPSDRGGGRCESTPLFEDESKFGYPFANVDLLSVARYCYWQIL